MMREFDFGMSNEVAEAKEAALGSRERLRKAVNSSIRWGWFDVIGALMFVPLNLYFFLKNEGTWFNLVVAIIWVVLGIWGVYALVVNYKRRWFYLGTNR